ncbi:MAG: nitroreductase family protein [Anaerovoracaceae bacterium]|jgi:nitroreductase
MELKDALQKRQSVRRFTSDIVKPDDLTEILEAARISPSGNNYQNWHFVIIENRSIKEKIAKAILDKNELISSDLDKKDGERGSKFRKYCRNFSLFFVDAPVLILVYSAPDIPSGYLEYQLAGWSQDHIDELFKRTPGIQSIGAAMQSMSLRAVDLGYGSCWMTGHNYASGEIEKLMEDEGLDLGDYFLCCMMALGVPQPNIKSPGRKPLNEICTFFP